MTDLQIILKLIQKTKSYLPVSLVVSRLAEVTDTSDLNVSVTIVVFMTSSLFESDTDRGFSEDTRSVDGKAATIVETESVDDIIDRGVDIESVDDEAVPVDILPVDGLAGPIIETVSTDDVVEPVVDIAVSVEWIFDGGEGGVICKDPCDPDVVDSIVVDGISTPDETGIVSDDDPCDPDVVDSIVVDGISTPDETGIVSDDDPCDLEVLESTLVDGIFSPDETGSVSGDVIDDPIVDDIVPVDGIFAPDDIETVSVDDVGLPDKTDTVLFDEEAPVTIGSRVSANATFESVDGTLVSGNVTD